MMHHSSTTVTLTNDNKKPYREYGFKKLHDKCKTCEVILPFDSNYEISIKNDNYQRLKVEIDIDGTIISGTGGLVIDGKSQSSIERFVDTASKLFFTKKTNEKVSDPSNKENGFLTIKCVKESLFYTQPDYGHPNFVMGGPIYNRNWFGWKSASYDTTMIGSTRSLGHTAGDNMSLYNATATTGSILRSCGTNYDTGATVEGSESSQKFRGTTWAGDELGSDFIFQFKMLGKENEINLQDEKDLMEYKRLKAKFEK